MTLFAQDETKSPIGTIVLVAKCPLPGTAKTRLAKDFGFEKAASIAQAMLCDILQQVGFCSPLSNVDKILLYAPPNDHGREIMLDLLRSLHLESKWHLMPMLPPPYKDEHDSPCSPCPVLNTDLLSSNLGDKLADALIQARNLFKMKHLDNSKFSSKNFAAVVFLGMDSPEICVEEIYYALLAAADNGTTHICPAQDGGYGMICIPPCITPSAFQGVRWSDKLTCMSQLKVLGDCGARNIRVGQLMYDIDETEDVFALASRLCRTRKNSSSSEEEASFSSPDALESSCLTGAWKESFLSHKVSEVQQQSVCHHTWEELCKLEVVLSQSNKENGKIQFYVNRNMHHHGSKSTCETLH